MDEIATFVDVNRQISSIWLDDRTDDGSGGFKGCFTPPAQNSSYIDVQPRTLHATALGI
jgi:hypothetical protein